MSNFKMNRKRIMDNLTKTNQLRPPKNFREITPRCCGTCKHGYFEDGLINCERIKNDHDSQGVASAEDHYMYVCDYYKQGE